MNNVLIVGEKGQLGQDCLDVFSDVPVLIGLDLPDVDFSDRKSCLECLDRVCPEIIINCAAYTAVDACESDQSCWKANAELPGYLAEWTEAHGAFLVHISTDYVFEGNKPLFEALVETDDVGPISEYGRSKLAGERAIQEATSRYAILRTAWLYGAHGRNFLKTMLRLILQNPGKELNVVNDQYGSPTWSYTLARQIRAVVEQRATGIFHASAEGFGTWYELACAFLEELEIEHSFVPCSSDAFPTPTKRPSNSIMENAHAKALGINQFKDWRDELTDFVKKHGETVLREIEAL